MASYLDNRPGPSETFAAEISERRAARALSPEEQEAQQERASRVQALLAEAALVDAGDPAALEREELRRAERDKAYQASVEAQEMEDARNRPEFAE